MTWRLLSEAPAAAAFRVGGSTVRFTAILRLATAILRAERNQHRLVSGKSVPGILPNLAAVTH